MKTRTVKPSWLRSQVRRIVSGLISRELGELTPDNSYNHDQEDPELCQPRYIVSGDLALQWFALSCWLYRGRRAARPTPCCLMKPSSTLLGIPISSPSCSSCFPHATPDELRQAHWYAYGATRIAWRLKKDEIQKDAPGITRKKFLYTLSRASYEKQWGKNYQRPTFGEKFLAFLYKLIPKFGPLRVLQFRTLTPQKEKMFEASFNATLDRYRAFLSDEAADHLELIKVGIRLTHQTTIAGAKLKWKPQYPGAG